MIDWNRVDELREEVGEEAFEEVVALFLEEVDETVAGISAISDAAQVRDVLHFLKGSALNLGFQSLADYCRDGESKVDQGKTVELTLVIDRYRDSRRAFLAELSKRTDA
ncbi:Hpt domain-containing protein [Actibacterium pelagium]|uniref:Nickel transporter n=1 Tax=Actibacterium pelagium TaxID=2029103 RepID=A0A917AIW3_9RHOB|nr:Hpt domain-containing protein [Actibacterium pelagium]GGE55558.1 nickel transporter [Actibacterium pelagium]